MSNLAVFALIGLVLVYAVGIYNALQRLKTQIVASIQEIGNQLKRQTALLPNLQAAAKGYLKHEKSIYDAITEARKSVSKAESNGKLQDVDKAIDQLQAAIPQIQVVVESNPELKADKTITKFMDELTDTTDKLMYARRTLIDLTQSYNEKLVVFPSNLVAMLFGFKPEVGLESPTTGKHMTVSTKETEDLKIDW